MSKQGEFMIFYAEQYEFSKHLTGRQLAELFSKYQVWEYLYSCYEALHTVYRSLQACLNYRSEISGNQKIHR